MFIPSDPGIVDTGVQLAVGESTGAALTKLDIALSVQFTGLEEMLHLFMAALGILTPLQDDGTQTVDCQNQRRKHAGRTKAYHHRPMLGKSLGFGHFIVGYRGKAGALAAGILQNLFFIAVHGHINGVDDADVRLLSGIHRPPDNLQFAHLGSRDSQQLCCLIGQLRHIMLRVHGNFAYSNHILILYSSNAA